MGGSERERILTCPLTTLLKLLQLEPAALSLSKYLRRPIDLKHISSYTKNGTQKKIYRKRHRERKSH